MSSSSAKIFLCLRWLCLLVIFCANTPSCQGVQKLCGNKLSQSLDLICKNGFARKTKKSIDPLDYYIDIENDIEESPLEELSFFSKVPTNVLAKTRRRRYGVANECCKKPCSMAELRSYCL